MSKSISGLFHGTTGSKQSLLDQLESSGTKVTKENVQFITKDASGQIVWLETGNNMAGLKHILDGNGKTPGHAKDFEKAFNVSRDQVPDYLHKVISSGKIISNKLVKRGTNEGFERVYYYEGKHYVVTGIGTNGFIVSAYPKRIKGDR